MSYGGSRRRYEDDLAYGDDYGPPQGGGVQRWDRDRFESMRNRNRYSGGGGGGSRDYGYEDRFARSSGPRGTRFVEEDRYYEDDRYSRRPPAPAPEFMYERANETQGRELAPYRDRWEYDDPRPSRGPPSRPGMVRRQSSLDTFERRARPNYADQHRDLDVKIQVSGPEGNRRDYYDDRERWDSGRSGVYEEDYRDFRIRRERERSIVRPLNDRYDDDEYERPQRRVKRGKTKMPKRLVHKKAILDLGYPYEEDDTFFWVQTAMDKDQIDEVIKFSETCFREERTSYRYNESRMLEAPPESADSHSQEQAEEQGGETEIVETTTTRVIENPTDEEIARYSNKVSGGEVVDEGRSGNGRDEEQEESHESVHISEHRDSRSRGRSAHSQANIDIEETNEQEEVGSVAPSNTLRPVDTRNSGYSRSRSKSHHRRSRSSHVVRSAELPGGEEVLLEESNNIGGPLGALVLTDRRKSRGAVGFDDRRDRDIKAEIRALEKEKEILKKEREADERRRKAERKYDEEIRKIDRSDRDGGDKDVVRVEKDRRGRLALVRSDN